MLRKHINRTATYLTQSHSIDGKKATYQHVLSFTCNNCLYHVHNATLEGESNASKSVVIGGYSDLGFDNDSYIRDLSVLISEPLTEQMATALTDATVSIDAAVIAKAKAVKKSSEKYSFIKYKKELRTINELLSTVQSPETAERVVKYEQALSEFDKHMQNQSLSPEDAAIKFSAIEGMNGFPPYSIASFIKDTQTGSTALKLFKDYFADDQDGIVVTEVADDELRFESSLLLVTATVDEPTQEEYEESVSAIDELDCDQSIKDSIKSSKCLLKLNVFTKSLSTVGALKTFILATADVMAKLDKDCYFGCVLEEDYFLGDEFLEAAKILKNQNDWVQGLGICISYSPQEQDESILAFTTRGMEALGFGTEISYVPQSCESDEELDLWLSLMTSIIDTIMNTGFIFTAENAALTLNLKDSYVVFEKQDSTAPAVITNIRPLR